MIIQSAYKKLIQSLAVIYDEREAELISQYIFEDAFRLFQPFPERTFNEAEQTKFEETKSRLLRHEPWQHIIGKADFYGLKFHVNPSVLIPRPETEELVYLILQDLKQLNIAAPSVLEIGTGSGCIPISLKKEKPSAQVTALDVSDAALKTAQSNAVLNNVNFDFKSFNILDETLWNSLGQFDVIVSNPPYIPNEEKRLMHKNVLDHEPHLALFVENDAPLIFYDRIAEFAIQHLNKNGNLYFEVNEHLGKEVVEILEKYQFRNVSLEQDMSGRDRMVKGRK